MKRQILISSLILLLIPVFAAAADTTPPSPDPAGWEIPAQATGWHTIAMQAEEATDLSGVEYFFQCTDVNSDGNSFGPDPNFDSGWQDEAFYQRGDFDSNTTYTFRVRYRDKSVNHNQTEWSDPNTVTTSAFGSDDLPPFPSPCRWLIKPRVTKIQPPPWVSMTAMPVIDEDPNIMYYFACIDVNALGPDPSFDSGWIPYNVYTIKTNLVMNSTYTFTVIAKDSSGNETDPNGSESSVTVGSQGGNVLTVPLPYHTIQSAINAAAASNGDVVQVKPGTYTGSGNYDITFKGKVITVMSTDPNNPAIVTSTIIDVPGVPGSDRRGFLFNSGEAPNSVLAGFTIRDGLVARKAGNGSPFGGAGGKGVDEGGGGIVCVLNSSPTIRNCIIDNCHVYGQDGGDGAWGTLGDPDPCNPIDPVDGGPGGPGGRGFGGGIYCDSTSDPLILNCEISNCVVRGGNGGDGGDGEYVEGDPNFAEGVPGAGGDANEGFGGGIAIAGGSNAVVINCIIRNCYASNSIGGKAGHGLATAPDGDDNKGFGGGMYYGAYYNGNFTFDTRIEKNVADSNGGGIYCDVESQVTITGCDISDNNSINGSGGGIWCDRDDTMLRLSNCDVVNNVVYGNEDGGGIYAGDLNDIYWSLIIIESNSTIRGNTAGYAGGGLLALNNTLMISDSTISDNVAYEGGGIWAFSCGTYIDHSVIEDNSSTESGGGLSLINAFETVIENSRLTGNATARSGGGLLIEGPSDWANQLINCLVTGNTAYSDGAGLSNNTWAWTQVTNCTFADNQVTSGAGVGGGVSCAEYWAGVEILNSILWGNTANGGGSQIAVGDPEGSIPDGDGPYASVYVDFSDVQGGEAGVWLEDETEATTYLGWEVYSGNIDLDPLFADTDITEQTYFLSQRNAGQLAPNSPCVDAGDGLASDLSLAMGMPLTTRTDFVADSDTDNTIDMGYHYQAGLEVPQYQLTIEVHDDGYGPFGKILPPWQPGVYDVNQGTVVELIADPWNDPCVDARGYDWEVYQWTGADFAPMYPSDPNYNTVTMNSDKMVKVEFGPHNAYKLVTRVVGSGTGTIEPEGLTIWSPGTEVSLTAEPDEPFQVIIWNGTDDDYSDLGKNKVTMDEHKVVEVEFYTPVTRYVPGDYTSIQDAITAAHDRDIIEISPGVYDTKHNQIIPELGQPFGPTEQEFLFIFNKAVTLRSNNPEDPSVVAETILDGGKIVMANVGRNTIINGLTIRNTYYWNYRAAEPGEVWIVDDAEGVGVDGGPGGDTYGGAIDLLDPQFTGGPASPIIKNCRFENTSVHGVHGGNGAGGVDGSGFSGNGGPGGKAYGGGMYCGSHSAPLVINCSFVGCSATGGDGGSGGNVGDTEWPPGHGGGWGDPDPGASDPFWIGFWEYGPFEDFWKYSGYGGAVYCDQDSSPEFIDCNFIGNRAYGGSCGISGTYGQYIVNGWPYEHFRIDRFGGAVYAVAGSTAKFTGCTFIDNIADPNGPLTHREGDQPPVSADPFLGYGGAIAFEDGAMVTFEDCTFRDNFAPIGGASWSTWADPVVIDCNFSGNSAYHGGALLFVGGTAQISGSNFSQNRASGSAGQGGAICSFGANANILDCTVAGNEAEGSGGGIYISSQDMNGVTVDGNNTVLIKNCLITDNIAKADGGGVSANWNSDPNIINCTIADNTVTGAGGRGGGVYCSYGNYTRITNSIIWDNSAPVGYQLAIGTASRPSRADVLYSDVLGGQSYVYVGPDCTLVWDVNSAHPDYPSNTLTDPLFETGPLGNYYLSQIAAGQLADSVCVDTGKGSAEYHGLNRYTTRTDERPDRNIVDMGYHYPFSPDAEPCRFCELFRDGIINFNDFALLLLNWPSSGCSPANDWCNHSDVTFDTYVDFYDIAFFVDCWLVEDAYPPVPNPSEWKVEPYSSSTPQHPNSISMVAETATDAWDYWVGDVQYYFDCVYGDCNDSGWQDESNYIDPNLTVGVEYGYRVRARDASEQIPNDGTGEPGNKTDWSPIRYAIVGEVPPPPPDEDPPEPDPMTWAAGPAATSETSISMTATTAVDACTPPVEYYFECTSDGNYSSTWQSDPLYTASGLTPETEYTFMVRARDSVTPTQNMTGWSDPCSATTPAEEPPPDTGWPIPVEWDVEPFEDGGMADPWNHMSAMPAEDPEGNGPVWYQFQCIENDEEFTTDCDDIERGYSSPWMQEGDPRGGLEWHMCLGGSGQGYHWRFRVRDSADPNVISPWSETKQAWPEWP